MSDKVDKASLTKQLEDVEREFKALREKYNTLKLQRTQIDKQMAGIVDRQKQLQGKYEVLAPFKELEKDEKSALDSPKQEKEVASRKGD